MLKILVLIVVVMGQPTLASELPKLTEVAVTPSVSFDLTTDILTYSYALRNSTVSVGHVGSFSIDISLPPGSVKPGGSTLTNDSSFVFGFNELAILKSSGVAIAEIIPVGLAFPIHAQCKRCESGLSVSGAAVWNYPLKFDIAPGQERSGHIMTSRGIPGIRSFKMDPNVIFDDIPDEIATNENRLGEFRRQIAFFGQTIGPDAPKSLESANLVDRLISLKHQSLSLGWLGGKEFVEELDEKLDQAKKALTKGKGFKARKKLEQFIKKLEQQRKEQLERQHEASEKGKQEKEEHAQGPKTFLTDNAFFLLKPNAEFILSKLPQKPRDKEEERESHEK